MRIKEIEDEFLNIQNHSSFIIRERLYKGSPKFGKGLRPLHEKVANINKKAVENEIPNEYLTLNGNEFTTLVQKLSETIQLLIFMVENGGIMDEILKLITLVEIEMDELENFVILGLNFDTSSIQTPDEISNQRVFELGLIIDDNFTQISSSSEWRLRKADDTLSSEINFDELSILIDFAKNTALLVNLEEYLELLSILSINIRDSAATDLMKLRSALEFFITTCRILYENPSFQFEGHVITSQSVKGDIEHKINLKKLDWLIKVHESITEEYPEDQYDEKFATLLYKLSRDASEEFLWTILRLAREQENQDLENISIAYANLASMLLSVNGNLIEIGRDDLASAITQAKEIRALDLIDDLVELYSLDNMGIEKLVNAIGKQLEDMKLLAYQIIQMDDIRDTFQMIVQFTDMDANFSDGMSLEDYISTLGK